MRSPRQWLLRFGAGSAGGLFMMVSAVVWFATGLALGYIFFYPLILFVLGVLAIIKDVFGPENR